MKRIILILLIIIPVTSRAQVNFFTNFSSGAIGEIKLDERMNKQNKSDSLEQYIYNIKTKADPTNPASPKLEPSKRWFYFLMTGVKDKEIVLNINYNDSRRPVYSYDNINWNRFTKEEVPVDNKSITKIYQNDSVWIAYFVPYSNDRLKDKIAEWNNHIDVKEFTIGESENGREMTMLAITNNIHDGIIPNKGELKYGKEDKKKKVIYIHGRIHPSETPSSWQLEGIIDILASNSNLAKDLRENTIFYILPFTNPDGVNDGMSRSNSHGINLEVNWDNEEDVTAKEVKNIRNFLYTLKNNKIIPTAFLNMHSQIAPHVTYWIHDAESTSDKYYNNLMLLANITMMDNPYFSKDELSFSKIAPRYLEGWMYEQFKKQTLSTTFETPYTYYHKDENGIWVTPENMKEQGLNTIIAITDLFDLSKENRITIDEPKRGKGFKRYTNNNYFYFGNSYLKAKKDNSTLKYKCILPEGEYNIYKWNLGENMRASKPGENEWVKIGEYNQKHVGKFIYKVGANKNDKLDRIIFIKKDNILIDRNKIYVQ